jgi:outer membrane lipoprotein carrier protein
MKKIIRYLFAIALIAAALPAAQAKDTGIDGILNRIEKADRRIKSVTFDFKQQIIYSLTGEKQEIKGDVAFKKPDNFYFHKRIPLEQTIISNGKDVWVYTPEYRQVVVDSFKKWVKSGVVPKSLVSFSGKWDDLRKNYAFELIEKNDYYYIILLKPLNEEDNWRIMMWIDSNDLVPVKIKLKGENVEIITDTENYKINPKIDEDIFEFKKPEDAEIIEMP